MDTLTIGAALVGSFATAFVLQKALLRVLFRALDPHTPQQRRARD